MKGSFRRILAHLGAWGFAHAASAQVTLNLETTTYVPAVETVVTDTETIVAGSASVATAYGSGTAISTFGSMQLTSTSSSTNSVPYGDTLATLGFAEAEWEDSILVTAAAPELNGTNGRLHAQFTVSGSLNTPFPVASTFVGADPVSAGWQVSVSRGYQFGDENSVNGSRSVHIDMGPVSLLNGTANFQTFDLVIPFTFGEAFDFRFTGRAQSYAQPRGMEVGSSLGSSAIVNVTWLGIAGVTDETNSPLSGIAISSTGDWITAAVPEPSTYAVLVGATALGLAGWSRRRRQRPSPL